MDSFGSSLATNSSSRTHEAEAVIQRATRALSLRSGTSAVSNVVVADDGQSQRQQTQRGVAARPRLVPFTSAARVPVPKLPSSSFFAPDAASPSLDGSKTRRVASQMAKVFRNAAAVEPADATAASAPVVTDVDEPQVIGQPDGEGASRA